MSYYFAIIGTNDGPLYELEIGTYKQSGDGKPNFPVEIKELQQFIVNASLDILQDQQFKNNQIFFKNLDAFYGYQVYSYLTQGNIKFIISTNVKNQDESIRQFFIEVNELYVKNLLSPFYNVNDPIRSAGFDSRVCLLAKKYL
ncbi:hypothetical protein KL905_000631 [Ogataea polymorpha]|uniref:uncharacterized protein n=1 Tax=Ogataea polymorpha TaxID=460523 RepID=UPI0007F4EE55|nr:uncharacterized protein OGAPODRAFT_8259 [Ogataea polymorpha]KAG7881884.1 hypothetical protein KL937_001507 [Ogataea polymorpha]KAG7891029.1 hypothetical protein KL936_002313 [Ogataea polymorpha]KAG7894175.1 hypothetical protein KL908_002452 [Ogataea polymorpha]KAG7902129.1 hypothetical protein KL935_002089 [Ogataea polymorpha]KAG7911164.1 hypothetical protein KL906_001544 [Ogataea polymorpha]